MAVKKPKPTLPDRAIVSVTPPLQPKDRRALESLVTGINKSKHLFTGSRFVFRGSVVVLTKPQRAK